MIARDMKPYGLYEKGQIGESPTGLPIYGWNKIATIGVAVTFKSQYVDNKDLNYRLTTLSGITDTTIAIKEQCIVEGINTPDKLEKLTGFRIVDINPYARRTQLVLEKVGEV